jgi:cytochrome c oxidase assembly protein subunit 11
MGVLGAAAPALYDAFTGATGYGGRIAVAEAAPASALEREITVRLDASRGRGMPWRVAPVERSLTVRIGEPATVWFEATNPADRIVTARASSNVAPQSAGGFVATLDCFCAEAPTLAPGQTARLPVTFFVDPSIVEDPEASRLPSITLSYTFFETADANRAAN